MKNYHLTKVLVTAASIVFAFLLGEIAARLLLPAWFHPSDTHASRTVPGYEPPINVYDPEIGWVLSPGSIKSHHILVPDVTYSIDHGERLTSLQPPSGPLVVATGVLSPLVRVFQTRTRGPGCCRSVCRIITWLTWPPWVMAQTRRFWRPKGR